MAKHEKLTKLQNQTVIGKKVAATDLAINDRAVKRVIAPFVRIVRKGEKPPHETETSTQFSYYLQKKPSVLIRDLSSFLSDSVDLASLIHQSTDVLKTITKAAGATLYMMDPATNEIYQNYKATSSDRYKIKWKIEEGTTVAAYVAYKKECVLLDDIICDSRFPEGIGYLGETIKSVMCVPVVTPSGECFAVIEIFKLLFDPSFTSDDLQITLAVTGWMGAAIQENSKRLALQRQQELNDYLLELTKCSFGNLMALEKMISELAKLAKQSLASEKATFFIIDKESDDLLADMYEEEADESKQTKYPQRIRFTKERGIAAFVARTGQKINLKDAYKDASFNKEIDQKTGFITRSILCVAIKGSSNGDILGVLQVVNKKFGASFNTTDEILLQMFSSYCALILRFSKTRKQFNFMIKALLIAALCHDVDHKGYTDNFFELIKDDIIYINDDPPIQNHCYSITRFLLENSKVLKSITEDEFDQLMNEIRKLIVLTNQNKFFNSRLKLKKLFNAKTFNWKNVEHRDYVKSIMMVAACLSGDAKPFLMSKILTDNYFAELYRQGDLEKNLGLCPLPRLDREKTHTIPESQIEYFNILVLPCFSLLKKIFPNTVMLYKEAEQLRNTWQELIDVRRKKCWRQDDSIVQKRFIY